MKKQLFLGILVSSIIMANTFAMKRSHDGYGNDEPEAKRSRTNDSAQECERDDSTPQLDASVAPAPDASGQEATPMQEATPTLQDAPHTPDANTLSHNTASPIQESIASAPNANMPTKTISFADTGLALFDPDAPYYYVPSLAMLSIISVYNEHKGLSDEEFSAMAGALPEKVSHKLKQYKKVMDTNNNQNQKLLHAASDENLDLMKYLIWSCQANPNACLEDSKITPLHIAAQNSNAQMVRMLLAAKAHIGCHATANVGQCSKNGLTPLHLATLAMVRTGDDEVMQILIDAGADVNDQGEDGNHSAPLHYATRVGEGSVRAIEILCAAGANIMAESPTEGYYTPLHFAADSSNVAAIQTLLSMGADVNWRSSVTGRTPIVTCGQNGSDLETFKKVIQVLCQAGAHIFDIDADGDNLLLYYLGNLRPEEHPEKQEESIKITKYLLEELSFDVNAFNYNGENALMSVFINTPNNTQIMRLLLNHRANVNQATLQGKSALHYAAEHSHLETIQMLCQASAQINARDDQEFSPLHYAAYFGNNCTLQALCQMGANVNITSHTGHTPLHLAVDQSHKNVILPLLQARAFIDIQNDQGNTPISLAVIKYREANIISPGLDANSLAKAQEIVTTLTQYGSSQPEPTK